MKKRLLALLVFMIIVMMLCSCGENTGNRNTQAEEYEMTLMTKEELIEYWENSDWLGEGSGWEEAFDGIDLDEYIKERSVTWGMIERGWPPESFLSGYKLEKQIQRELAIMAKEIISADSTDEEYEAFVAAFMEAVGKEFYYLGTYDSDFFRYLRGYNIVYEKAREPIYIGRTKYIDEYDITENLTGYGAGTMQIRLPFGELIFTDYFCYSHDNKFFLVTMNNGTDPEFDRWELRRIFTEVTY